MRIVQSVCLNGEQVGALRQIIFPLQEKAHFRCFVVPDDTSKGVRVSFPELGLEGFIFLGMLPLVDEAEIRCAHVVRLFLPDDPSAYTGRKAASLFVIRDRRLTQTLRASSVPLLETAVAEHRPVDCRALQKNPPKWTVSDPQQLIRALGFPGRCNHIYDQAPSGHESMVDAIWFDSDGLELRVRIPAAVVSS